MIKQAYSPELYYGETLWWKCWPGYKPSKYKIKRRDELIMKWRFLSLLVGLRFFSSFPLGPFKIACITGLQRNSIISLASSFWIFTQCTHTRRPLNLHVLACIHATQESSVHDTLVKWSKERVYYQDIGYAPFLESIGQDRQQSCPPPGIMCFTSFFRRTRHPCNPCVKTQTANTECKMCSFWFKPDIVRGFCFFIHQLLLQRLFFSEIGSVAVALCAPQVYVSFANIEEER